MRAEKNLGNIYIGTIKKEGESFVLEGVKVKSSKIESQINKRRFSFNPILPSDSTAEVASSSDFENMIDHHFGVIISFADSTRPRISMLTFINRHDINHLRQDQSLRIDKEI